MAKLSIELKQHTPLIHFQSEQPGAILRATEVKPKLDKFLIEYVFENKFEKYKQYLIGYKADKKDKIETSEEKETESEKEEKKFKGKKAFDYKLRIITETKNIQEENIENEKDGKTLSFPNYFGNMGNDDGNKNRKNRFVFCDSLYLEIFSFHKKLLVKIGEKLPLFLMKHNFGQRQSKGFGSFFINDENKYSINKKEYSYNQNEVDSLKKSTYSFKFHECINKSIEKQINNRKEFYKESFAVFDQIEKLYTKMRSGGQTGNSYIKQFFKIKNIIWDKDVIRNRFVNNQDEQIDNGYLVKDLLGLSVDEKWDGFNVKKEYKGEEEDKIERVESPILFKPIKDKKGEIRIYVIIKNIPKEFFNKVFTIMKCVKEKDGKSIKTVDHIELKTPKKNDFSVDKFWKFVQKKEHGGKKHIRRKDNYGNSKRKDTAIRQKESLFSIDTKELNKLQEIKKKLKENKVGESSDTK